MVRGHYYYHIHHYFFFGYFIPWTRFKNPVSLACQAFSAGVYVEGVSEWGMAPLSYPLHLKIPRGNLLEGHARCGMLESP